MTTILLQIVCGDGYEPFSPEMMCVCSSVEEAKKAAITFLPGNPKLKWRSPFTADAGDVGEGGEGTLDLASASSSHSINSFRYHINIMEVEQK